MRCRSIKHAMQVRKLENRMDALYITALTELFQNVTTQEDMVNVLKLREIYRSCVKFIGI